MNIFCWQKPISCLNFMHLFKLTNTNDFFSSALTPEKQYIKWIDKYESLQWGHWMNRKKEKIDEKNPVLTVSYKDEVGAHVSHVSGILSGSVIRCEWCLLTAEFPFLWYKGKVDLSQITGSSTVYLASDLMRLRGAKTKKPQFTVLHSPGLILRVQLPP